MALAAASATSSLASGGTSEARWIPTTTLERLGRDEMLASQTATTTVGTPDVYHLPGAVDRLLALAASADQFARSVR